MKIRFGIGLLFFVMLLACGGKGNSGPDPVGSPSQLVAAYDLSSLQVTLTWSPAAGNVDGYNVEGSVNGGDYSRINGTLIPAQYTGIYLTLSETPPEITTFSFRVQASRGGATSAYSNAARVTHHQVLPASDLSAEPRQGAVRLTWVNHSQVATKIQIIRFLDDYEARVTIDLPATAQSYVDEGVSLDVYNYSIRTLDDKSSANGPSIIAAPLNPPGAPVLTPASMMISQWYSITSAALAPTGSWGFGYSFPSLGILQSSWSNWPEWQTGNSYSPAHEFLKIDNQSYPHLVFVASTQLDPEALRHVYYNGTEWQSESILNASDLQGSNTNASTSFCLDSTGSPWILQDLGSSNRLADLSIIRKVEDVWVSEKIYPQGTSGFYSRNTSLRLDKDGKPHAVLSDSYYIQEVSQNAEGDWVVQPILTLEPYYGAIYCVDAVWADENNAWVFYIKDLVEGGEAYYVIRKMNGTWQTPIQLRKFPHWPFPATSIALSPDGTRVAAACITGKSLNLFTSGEQGWVESLIPNFELSYPFFRVGFDAQNRLHVLVKPSGYSGAIQDYRE